MWLRKQDAETDARARTLESALEKLQKARRKPTPTPTAAGTTPPTPAATATKPATTAAAAPATATAPPAASPTTATSSTATSTTAAKTPTPVQIDFDGLHERLRTIRVSDAVEEELVWSPDSKKLAFTSTIRDQKGLFTVSFP